MPDHNTSGQFLLTSKRSHPSFKFQRFPFCRGLYLVKVVSVARWDPRVSLGHCACLISTVPPNLFFLFREIAGINGWDNLSASICITHSQRPSLPCPSNLIACLCRYPSFPSLLVLAGTSCRKRNTPGPLHVVDQQAQLDVVAHGRDHPWPPRRAAVHERSLPSQFTRTVDKGNCETVD